MDNDIKRLLGILGVGTVIFILFKPKGFFKKKTASKDLTTPKKADSSDKKYEDSIVAIKAMRNAIDAGESVENLNELNVEILNDYDIKVYQDPKTGKLYTCDRQGTKIAEEKP